MVVSLKGFYQDPIRIIVKAKKPAWSPSDINWDESRHPREPAGSAQGGEFTSSGGGRSTGGWSSVDSVTTPKGKEMLAKLTKAYSPEKELPDFGRRQALQLPDGRFVYSEATGGEGMDHPELLMGSDLLPYPDDDTDTSAWTIDALRIYQEMGVIRIADNNSVEFYQKPTSPQFHSLVDRFKNYSEFSGEDKVFVDAYKSKFPEENPTTQADFEKFLPDSAVVRWRDLRSHLKKLYG